MHNNFKGHRPKAVMEEEGSSRRSSLGGREETPPKSPKTPKTPKESGGLPKAVEEGARTPRGPPKDVEEGGSSREEAEGYKCLYCREVFEKNHLLIKHSKTRHKKGLTTCRQCMSVFKDREAIQ